MKCVLCLNFWFGIVIYWFENRYGYILLFCYWCLDIFQVFLVYFFLNCKIQMDYFEIVLGVLCFNFRNLLLNYFEM